MLKFSIILPLRLQDSDSEDYYNHDMSKFKEEMSQKNESSQDRYIPMKSSVDEVQIIENKNMVSAKIDKTNDCESAYF